MRIRHTLWLAFALLVASGFGCVAQETSPAEIIEVGLPILLPNEAARIPVIAEGTVVLPADCEFCYLSSTQYKIVVPEGVEGLVIELSNTSDPFGDIDLIVRHLEPVTEDESAYYYSYRTYGGEGEERLELPEEGLEFVDPGEYYITVVSFVEDGTTFELRAAAIADVIYPDAVAVEAAVPATGTLQPGESSLDLGWQYSFEVVDQIELLYVHATGVDGNLDLLVGHSPVARTVSGTIAAYRLRGSGGDEQLVLGLPESGLYWIALENRSRAVIDYALTVIPLPEIGLVTESSTVTGTVGWETNMSPLVVEQLATERGVLGLRQLRVELPEDAVGVRLHLRGTEAGDLGLHVRYGRPAEPIGGVVQADLSMMEGQEKGISLRDALIPETSLYVAVESLSVGEKAYALEVEFLY